MTGYIGTIQIYLTRKYQIEFKNDQKIEDFKPSLDYKNLANETV